MQEEAARSLLNIFRLAPRAALLREMGWPLRLSTEMKLKAAMLWLRCQTDPRYETARETLKIAKRSPGTWSASLHAWLGAIDCPALGQWRAATAEEGGKTLKEQLGTLRHKTVQPCVNRWEQATWLSQPRQAEQLSRVGVQASQQAQMAPLPLSAARPLAQLRVQGRFARTSSSSVFQCRLCQEGCGETAAHVLMDCVGAERVITAWLGDAGTGCTARRREQIAAAVMGVTDEWPVSTLAELAKKLEAECRRQETKRRRKGFARADAEEESNSSSDSEA